MPRCTVDTHPRHRVFINGIEWPNVSQCDTDQGWLEFYPTNEGGHMIIDPRSSPTNPTIYTELRWGIITIEPMDPEPVPAHTPRPAPTNSGAAS